MNLLAIAPWMGLIGLLGLAGLMAIKQPIGPDVAGAGIRKLGVRGLLGLSGFWFDGAGAMGAFGALGLWNHPNIRYKIFRYLGPLGVTGIPFLVFAR